MNLEYDPPRGPRFFPRDLDFEYDSSTGRVDVGIKTDTEKKLRKMETWGFAYVEYLRKEKNVSVIEIIRYSIGEIGSTAKVEALRRRVSYLQIVNPKIRFILVYAKKQMVLDTIEEMWTPEPNSITRPQINDRNTASVKTRNMEKELQDHIASYEDNIGLSLLGDIFPNKKKRYGLLREVRTGVFRDKISYSDGHLILPDNLIDFLSFNRYGRIAVVELKVNDGKLDVIAQILDYALFATRYKSEIIQLLENSFTGEQLPKRFRKEPVEAYVVNNHFHERFDEVAKYYSSKGHEIPFNLSKIVIGQLSEI